MAINKKTKKLGSYRFKMGEDSINLCPTLGNIEEFQKATGKDWMDFLALESNGGAEMAKFFFHFQYPEGDEEIESESDIYEAFFSRLDKVMSAEFQDQLIELVSALVGVDYQLVLAEMTKMTKASEKKETQAD